MNVSDSMAQIVLGTAHKKPVIHDLDDWSSSSDDDFLSNSRRLVTKKRKPNDKGPNDTAKNDKPTPARQRHSAFEDDSDDESIADFAFAKKDRGAKAQEKP